MNLHSAIPVLTVMNFHHGLLDRTYGTKRQRHSAQGLASAIPGPELNRTFAGALQLADGSIRHSAIEGATFLLYLRRMSLTGPSLTEKICP